MPPSDSDPQPEHVSVLVPRSASTPNVSSSRPFQFAIPPLSNATAIPPPQLPNLFQAEKQAKVICAQLQAEPKLHRSEPQRQEITMKQGGDSRAAMTAPRKPPALVSDPNCVLVSRRQEKNSLLRHIRNVRWRFADGDSLLCDYVVGSSAAVLFLTLRVLLVLVDMEEVGNVIEDLTRVAFINNWTMVCAFSIPEAAQYIETFKAQENAPFDSIKERIESDHASIFSSVLTLMRSVNKTDVVTLAQAFGSLANIMAASVDELSQCPGIGTLKAARIYDAFHQPFRRERM